MKKASMQDIADKVGVSRCAVSLVLSGKAKDKRISESLSNRILQAAKELNYTPNELARGLRTGLTKTLGVIVADISNEFFGELVYHIQQQAFAAGYSTIVTNSNEDPEVMLNGINLLVNRQVDGIIMVPTNNSQHIAKKIVSMKIPFVQVDRFIPGIDASYVILDNFKASYELTERLLARGRRRIAMIKHKTSALNGRLEGYIKALEDHRIYHPDLVRNIDYSSESEDIEAAISDLFLGNGNADSIIFQSHELFFTGMRFLRSKMIDFREKVSVACFDKTDALALVDFPLLYVEQPIEDIGKEAVNILINRIKGTPYTIQKVFDGTVKEV
ncbi:MAG: LacI family DNA-binding transcriptional regulator [Candidatus Cryptobacteroides sp.]